MAYFSCLSYCKKEFRFESESLNVNFIIMLKMTIIVVIKSFKATVTIAVTGYGP